VTTPLETPEETFDEPSPRGGWLILAAIALVAIPVLIGFFFLRADDDDASQALDAVGGTQAVDSGMGGGMGGGGSDTSAPSAVERPAGVGAFSEIQATDIVIEPDPAGGGAVLRVVTSVDVACAVSYGPTDALGFIATDTDMAGGGHTNHQPLMRGLEPGSTYSYQVSAIDPSGRLYQSDLMQFTYEPGDDVQAVETPAPNVVSLASVTDVSSEYSDAYAGRNAVDGDLSTEWSSAGDGDDAYIVLDFGEDMQFAGVGFRTREMTDGTSITTSFTVTVAGRTYGPFDAGPGMSIGRFQALGTSLRVDVETSTGGNTGAVEIEVYGQTDM
jgi:hypothetical protein